MSYLSQVTDPVVRFLKPVSEKAPEHPSMAHKLYASFYAVWNPIGRLRAQTDGLDKLNKFAIAILNGCELHFDGICPRVVAIRRSLKNINDFFGGVSFIGRVDSVFGLDHKGRQNIESKTHLKATSLTLLMISKGAEATRWLDTVQLLPVQCFKALDSHLGHIASRIGQTSVVQVLGVTTLGGVKDTFLIGSCICSIYDNLVTFVETSDRWTTKDLLRIWLSVANDLGKMTLALWFRWFVMTWTFVGIAAATSLIGISKILLDSYTEHKPFALPDWVKA
jgi:hypothetical protein